MESLAYVHIKVKRIVLTGVTEQVSSRVHGAKDRRVYWQIYTGNIQLYS